jgi:hypothetical protein
LATTRPDAGGAGGGAAMAGKRNGYDDDNVNPFAVSAPHFQHLRHPD